MLSNVHCCYIMISCPSDVTESEDALKIINEWNSKYTKDFNICFIPQFWQINTTSNINGERPQEILNRSLVYNSDCIVVIFWGKFGSDTGKEASGTLEELKTSYELKKKIGLFFCEKPINPSRVNPKDLIEINSVKENFGKLGVYLTYSHEYDFKAKFNHFLHELASEIEQKMIEEPSPDNLPSNENNEKANIADSHKIEVHHSNHFQTSRSTEKFNQLLLNIKENQDNKEISKDNSDQNMLHKMIATISSSEELIQTLTCHEIPNPISKIAYEQLQNILDLKKEADFFFFDERKEQLRKNLLFFTGRILSFLKLYYIEDGENLKPSPALLKQITNETIGVIHDYQRSSRNFLRTLQRLGKQVEETSS